MHFLRNPRLVSLARGLFLLAVVLSVTMALLPKPPGLPIDALGDKFEHMLAFAVLAGLAAIAFPGSSPWRRIEHLSFFGALIEVFQAMPSINRDCDYKDWIADTLAVAVVTLLAARLLPRPSSEAAKEQS